MIEQGESFDGYQVERVLGRGGMGVVYEAVQVPLGRRVALKVLRSDLARDPAFVERFRREARLQASIEHPNVLDVYEVAEPEPDELLLSMRLVDGGTLADLIRAGELDGERALSLLEQIAAALDAAHAAGLVHRDLKPQNVLVDSADHAYLADFGLSRATSEATASSRQMLGTVDYVAPEVVGGEAPGAAADLYALAATAFQCLTGDVVFPRGTDAAILFAHASEPPPRISEQRPELPAALDPVFEQALAKEPSRRPENAAALVAAIRAALGPERLAELDAPDPSRRPATTPATVPSPGHVPLPTTRDRDPRGKRWVAVALAAAAIGVGLAAMLIGWIDDEDEAPLAATPAVASGTETLGSSLGDAEQSLGCRGDAEGEAARPQACSIVQAELPGAQVVVPSDGTIVGWTVVGADGEMSLDVIRPRGADTVRVGVSQWESAGNLEPTRFAANLPVERGDVLGLQLAPGATIGVRSSEGATTDRWLDVFGGFYEEADREAGTGFDYEMLLRAEFVPGGELRAPEEIAGAAAAEASDGQVRRSVDVEIAKPRAEVTVQLVEVGDRVAIDLLQGRARVARMLIPGLLPGAQVLEFGAYPIEGEDFVDAGLFWVNPNSGRAIYHHFGVSRSHIKFLG